MSHIDSRMHKTESSNYPSFPKHFHTLDNRSYLHNSSSTLNAKTTPEIKKKERSNIRLEEENIKVFVRIRPFSSNELDRMRNGNLMSCVDINDSKIKICNPIYLQRWREHDSCWREYSIPKIVKEEVSNRGLFVEELQQLLPTVLEGMNFSVLCYGVTGTGKTHTMFGDSIWDSTGKEGEQGLIYQTAGWLIDQTKQLSDQRKKMILEGSFFEIYNEKVRDLMQDTPDDLKIAEDSNGTTYVKGLTIARIKSIDELRTLIFKGTSRRVMGNTAKNKCSSRSHAIVQFTITVFEEDMQIPGEYIQRTSKLMMVDLAGSERLDSSKSKGCPKSMFDVII